MGTIQLSEGPNRTKRERKEGFPLSLLVMEHPSLLPFENQNSMHVNGRIISSETIPGIGGRG
jgi:hypothetical protein